MGHFPSRIRGTVGRLFPLQHRQEEMEKGSFENQEQRKPLTETQPQQTACNHSNRRKIDTFPTSTERSDGKGRVYPFPLYVYNFRPLEDPFVIKSIQCIVINFWVLSGNCFSSSGKPTAVPWNTFYNRKIHYSKLMSCNLWEQFLLIFQMALYIQKASSTGIDKHRENQWIFENYSLPTI